MTPATDEELDIDPDLDPLEIGVEDVPEEWIETEVERLKKHLDDLSDLDEDTIRKHAERSAKYSAVKQARRYQRKRKRQEVEEQYSEGFHGEPVIDWDGEVLYVKQSAKEKQWVAVLEELHDEYLFDRDFLFSKYDNEAEVEVDESAFLEVAYGDDRNYYVVAGDELRPVEKHKVIERLKKESEAGSGGDTDGEISRNP